MDGGPTNTAAAEAPAVADAAALPRAATAGPAWRFVSGPAVAAALEPAALAAAATAVGWSAEKLAAQLEADPSLNIDPSSGRLLYACGFEHGHAAAGRSAAGFAAPVQAAAGAARASGLEDPPIDEAFALHRCAGWGLRACVLSASSCACSAPNDGSVVVAGCLDQWCHEWRVWSSMQRPETRPAAGSCWLVGSWSSGAPAHATALGTAPYRLKAVALPWASKVNMPFNAPPLSRPGSSHIIYLDFTGRVTSGTDWSEHSDSFVSTPEVDIDGDTRSFNEEERRRIVAVWVGVAADYAPFDVDVTTGGEGAGGERCVERGAL